MWCECQRLPDQCLSYGTGMLSREHAVVTPVNAHDWHIPRFPISTTALAQLALPGPP